MLVGEAVRRAGCEAVERGDAGVPGVRVCVTGLGLG